MKKGSPIKSVNDIAGKRIAAQQGSTNAKILREKYPQAQLREFPDQPAAFQALLQGQVDAYTNDGIQLYGLKAKAPKPADWDVVGDFFSEEPYGMAMRKGDAKFKAARRRRAQERASSAASTSRSTRSGSGRRASCRTR